MPEYLPDPEKDPFYWDEPIMADDFQQARKDCRQKAREYKVDLIDTDMPGWAVSAMREFTPSEDCAFDRIMVCWCSPVAVPEKQIAAPAIA